MELGNLRQIILYVSDMQKQVEFYRDILGLSISFPQKDDYSEESWVAFNTGECTLALHSGGRGRIGEDAPKFTFEVKDVMATKAHLESKGVKLNEIVEAYPGSFVCAFKDADNNTLFVQSHPH